MATTCFCPTNRVNWDKPGGLCQWNWPCDETRDLIPFFYWYVNDTKGTDVIIIPDKANINPSWMFPMPCLWLFCLNMPFVEANIFKIYEKNGNLALDYLRKTIFSESIRYSCNKIISASLDLEEATILTWCRRSRISLLCDNGMAPYKGQWLLMCSQWNTTDESVLQRCVDVINSKIAYLNGRNANAAFAQPVNGLSQQQPLAYGHIQPQMQVAPQVYYFNNSQPQQQLQTANDNAAFISNPAPQPQQPLVYGNVQPQLQVQPQVY